MPSKEKNVLKTLKFVKGKSIACDIFTNEISKDFRKIKSKSPSDYVNNCWNKYESVKSKYCKNEQSERAVNGAVFELIIRTCLYKEGIIPMYLQASVTFVPNVTYDLILFDEDKNAPIALSIKKSLRERYKQADLEAVALKYVHRRSKNYLIGLNKGENEQASAKIVEGSILGLDQIITADSKDFDDFIYKLKTIKLIEPPDVPVVKGMIVK